jgi:hypothetical protein
VRRVIDAHSVANTVRMARTVRRHASALLVEGSKDVRVYRNFANEQACEVVPAEGRKTALGALALLRKSGEKGVLVIVDADFSVLFGTQINDPDVIVTDGHDLECMLLQSPALTKLLIEYDLAPDQFGPNCALGFAKAVQPLGYLRFAAVKFGLQLDFKNIDFRAFTKPGSTPGVDTMALTNEVVRKNLSCSSTPEVLRQMIDRVADAAHDPWAVACGHDIIALLALLLSRKAGRDVLPYTVERQLRLSYEGSHFKLTKLHARIREWEYRNPHYCIMRTL